jgi:outer membrane protein assembly factor BamE
MKQVLLTIFCLIFLVACHHEVPFAYKIDVQQGNVLPQEKVDQLKEGMTAIEVEALLGAPISRNTFKQDRWDYLYYLKKNRKPVVEKKVSVYFDRSGRVIKIDRASSASEPSPEAGEQSSDQQPVVDKSQSYPDPLLESPAIPPAQIFQQELR